MGSLSHSITSPATSRACESTSHRSLAQSRLFDTSHTCGVNFFLCPIPSIPTLEPPPPSTSLIHPSIQTFQAPTKPEIARLAHIYPGYSSSDYIALITLRASFLPNMSDDENLSIYDEIEIEDMTFDETLQLYHYPCPCGDRFQIALDDLRDEQDIAVCPSCSLMIRVIFDLVSK